VIVVCGEALIDLTASRVEPGRFDAHPGGGPCNTAVGLGRMGTATSFLGRLSTDRFGVTLRDHLGAAGVSTDLVVDTDDPSTLALAHIAADGGASYAFYVNGTADPGLTTVMLPSLSADVTALHMGTCALVFEPCGTTLEQAFLSERASGTRFLALDPNVRMGIVTDVDAYRQRIVHMISAADLVKVSDADITALWPNDDVLERAAALARSGPALLVLTRGGDAIVGFRHDGSSVTVPAVPVDVVDTIGAGDTANAAMLTWLERHGRLTRTGLQSGSAEDIISMLTFAAKAAAITCSRAGANPPWASELGL
jgi:fructokinase